MIFLFPKNSQLEHFQLQNYQKMLDFQHLQTKLSNEFLLTHTRHDLLYTPHK